MHNTFYNGNYIFYRKYFIKIFFNIYINSKINQTCKYNNFFVRNNFLSNIRSFHKSSVVVKKIIILI